MAVLSFLFYYIRKIDPNRISKILNIFKLYNLSKNKFYIDEIYSNIIYKPFMFWSKVCSKIDWDYYDQKLIDSLGKLTIFTSKKSGYADYNWLDQKVVDGLHNKYKVLEYGFMDFVITDISSCSRCYWDVSCFNFNWERK